MGSGPTLRTAGLLLPLSLLLAGCTAQFEHLEGAVERNTEEMVSLQGEQRLIRQEVESLARLLRADDDSGVQTDARLITRMGQLETRLDQLIRLQEDNGQYMRNLSARVDLLTTRLGVPTVGEFKTVDEPVAGDALSDLPEEGRAIYDAAMLDRSRGNDDVARQGFEEFLTRYPNSELTGDALYWLGEMTYAQGDYTGALVHLSAVVEDHPDSERRADAMLKIVFCHRELGRPDRARDALARLQEAYPGSEQAALGAAGLED